MPNSEPIPVYGGPLDGGRAILCDTVVMVADEVAEVWYGIAESCDGKLPQIIRNTINGQPVVYARTHRGYEFTGWR